MSNKNTEEKQLELKAKYLHLQTVWKNYEELKNETAWKNYEDVENEFSTLLSGFLTEATTVASSGASVIYTEAQLIDDSERQLSPALSKRSSETLVKIICESMTRLKREDEEHFNMLKGYISCFKEFFTLQEIKAYMASTFGLLDKDVATLAMRILQAVKNSTSYLQYSMQRSEERRLKKELEANQTSTSSGSLNPRWGRVKKTGQSSSLKGKEIAATKEISSNSEEIGYVDDLDDLDEEYIAFMTKLGWKGKDSEEEPLTEAEIKAYYDKKGIN